MSEAAAHDDADSHEGFIHTPKQLVAVIAAAFVVPIVVISMIAHYVDIGMRRGVGSDGMSAQAIAERLQPVGTVAIHDASAAGEGKTGEQVFQAQCSACHASGALGAPKFGDQAAWAPRIKTGFDTLLNAALKGKGAMPPQGGGQFSDVEIARGVVYMANKAGANFAEPQASAASAPAAAASK